MCDQEGKISTTCSLLKDVRIQDEMSDDDITTGTCGSYSVVVANVAQHCLVLGRVPRLAASLPGVIHC